jgi:hypothetical protein
MEFAISRATRFREFKLDLSGAAKILDVALERHSDEATVLIARALLLRAEIALDMEETATASASMQKLRELSLSEEDRASLSSEIERLSEIKKPD